MAEIADNELQQLVEARNFLKSLYDDGATRTELLKVARKKFPNLQAPELDAQAKVEELGAGLTKKIDDFLSEQKKLKEEGEVSAFKERIDRVVKDRGYTKEGTEKLLGIMKDRGINDPDDAAIIFEASLPKESTKPRNFSSRMNFITPDGKDDEVYNRLMSDPDQFVADELMNALSGKEE